MVQIIERRPSFGENIGRALGKGAGEGIEQGLASRQRAQQLAGENEQIKQQLGIDLTGISDPEQRREFVKQKLTGQRESQLETDKEKRRKNLIREVEGGETSTGQQQFDQNQNDNKNKSNEINSEDILTTRKNSKEDPFAKAKKYALAGEKDLSIIAGKEAERGFQEKKLGTEQVSESYKENAPFITKTYDQYEDSQRRESILDRMDQLNKSGDLSDSGTINLLESLGMKSEWLKNPSNEEYSKLSLDLLGGGTLQADYGSRVLQSEFKVSQQRIPTLIQTPEGRKQISENIKAMMLPSRLKEERLQFYLDRQERTGQPLPHNLRGRILKDIKPQLEEAYDKFKQRNGRYKVREGTIPDDNVIEKYFYLADENTDKAEKMMRDDGYSTE